VSTSTLFWVDYGHYWEAVSNHYTHRGCLIWRVAGTANGASVARSTPYLLTLLNLTDWPQFETVEAAKLWCQQQNTVLTD
jgi:hypothetical protein